jgi:2-polyprenyl-3-methyl-5-hydroxy-6-metoxy-1,4-benzoquinol methylase
MKSYTLKTPDTMPINTSDDEISLEQLLSSEANSIDHINCVNILEIVDDPQKFLEILETKLRLIGECYIIGTSINNLCEYYLDNLISSDIYNQTIVHVKRLYDLKSITNLLNQYFTIDVIKTYGLYYHILIKRKGIKNG